ncbi:MAG: hypothetical protein ACOVOQ_09325 [Flavobacterium sp.]
MFTKLKLNVAAIATVALILTATITAPHTKAFGKQYDVNQDFSCCKNNNLVIHHYYKVNILWITVADGYTEEIVGKTSAEECFIRCAE